MKRICVLGAATAALLAVGGTTALAGVPRATTRATSAKKRKSGAAGSKVRCNVAFSLQVPADDDTVAQGATDGSHAGAVDCRDKQLGTGVEFDSFTTDSAGDLTGKWRQWFNTGSLHGAYTLTPNASQPPTAQSFAAASYTGTFTIKGGTGVNAKATGKGTMTCATPDSIHYTCKESGTFVLPSTTPTKVG